LLLLLSKIKHPPLPSGNPAISNAKQQAEQKATLRSVL